MTIYDSQVYSKDNCYYFWVITCRQQQVNKKRRTSLLQILKQTWFSKDNQKHQIFSGFWVWMSYHQKQISRDGQKCHIQKN